MANTKKRLTRAEHLAFEEIKQKEEWNTFVSGYRERLKDCVSYFKTFISVPDGSVHITRELEIEFNITMNGAAWVFDSEYICIPTTIEPDVIQPSVQYKLEKVEDYIETILIQKEQKEREKIIKENALSKLTLEERLLLNLGE